MIVTGPQVRVVTHFAAAAFLLNLTEEKLLVHRPGCDFFIPTPPSSSPPRPFPPQQHVSFCITWLQFLYITAFIPNPFFLSKLRHLSAPSHSVRLGDNSPLLTRIINPIIKTNLDYLSIQSRSSVNQCTPFFQALIKYSV